MVALTKAVARVARHPLIYNGFASIGAVFGFAYTHAQGRGDLSVIWLLIVLGFFLLTIRSLRS